MIALAENGLYRLLWGSQVYWFASMTEAVIHWARLEATP